MVYAPEQLNTAKAILGYLGIRREDLPERLIEDPFDEEDRIERTTEELLMAHYNEDSLASMKTVRFLKDFTIYKTRPNLNTPNKTFLRTADIYRKLGIKNYSFCLQLNNPLLIDVDPYDPNLTDDQKLMILHECQQNFWYFLREVCRLGGGVQFIANRANIGFLWSYLNHINTTLILPRQFGKTVSAQVLFFWLTYIAGKNHHSHLITLKEDNRMQFVEAIKAIRNSCPEWLTNVNYRDKDAGNSLTYSGFGDEYKNTLSISVPQIGKEAARNVARGLTVPTRGLDEPAYIKWIDEIINGAAPSTIKAREKARANRVPHGTFFITTPASILTESGKYMHDLLMESTEWRENYFDTFNESHLYKVIVKNSPNPKAKSPSLGMVYNYMQMGKDKDWVERMIDELKLDRGKAKIDLLLMWTEDGADRLFDDLTREAINNSKRTVLWSQPMGDTGLFIDWFVTKEEHAKMMAGETNDYYFIGSDTSGAQGKDACTIVIKSARDTRTVGVGRYALAWLTDVGEIIKQLLVEIKNSMLIIERNFAHHMIDQLLVSLPAVGIDPFKRIFNRIYDDPIANEKEYREIKSRASSSRTGDFYLRYKSFFGFVTNSNTREQLYGFIQEAVGLGGDKVYYDKLCNELINLKKKGGRIDHDNKHHDDLVIAWLLPFWFMKLGKSKSEYGIPPGVCFADAKLMSFEPEEEKNPMTEYERLKGEYYRKKFDELTDQLMACTDELMAYRIEHEIKLLSEFLPKDMKKITTIDTVLKDAKEARLKRIQAARRKVFS